MFVLKFNQPNVYIVHIEGAFKFSCNNDHRRLSQAVQIPTLEIEIVNEQRNDTKEFVLTRTRITPNQTPDNTLWPLWISLIVIASISLITIPILLYCWTHRTQRPRTSSRVRKTLYIHLF